MANIKPVLPSLREKKRYVAFEIISNKNFSYPEVSRAILGGTLSFMGELEFAKAGVIIIGNTYNAQNMKGLIKVNNKYAQNLKASLSLVSNIEEQPVIVRTIGVSGMVTKALNKYVAGAKGG